MAQIKQRKCAIVGCNLSREERQNFPATLQFANYKKSIDRFHKWLAASGNTVLIGLSDEPGGYRKIMRNYRICKRHFVQDDFHPNGKLKDESVPTLHLPEFEPVLRGIDIPEGTEQTPSPIRLHFLEYISRPKKQKGNLTLASQLAKRRLKINGNGRSQARGSNHTLDVAPLAEAAQVSAEVSGPPCLPEVGMPTHEMDLALDPSSAPQPHLQQQKLPGSTAPVATAKDEARRQKKILRDAVIAEFENASLQRDAERAYRKVNRIPPKRLSLVGVTSVSDARRKCLLDPTIQAFFREAAYLRKAYLKQSIKRSRIIKRMHNLIQKNSVEDALRKMTPFQRQTQIQNADKLPKGCQYSLQDKSDAIRLWKTSPKAYRFLTKFFSLPSLTTL